MLCTMAEIVLAVALVDAVVAPDRTDPDAAGTIRDLVGLVVLVGVIWVQAALYCQARQRVLSRWPYTHHAALGRPTPHPDPLDPDMMTRIADLELALSTALADAAVVAALSDDDLVMARRIATRATAALRALRAQAVTLDRAAAAALPPDQHQLRAARQTVRLRLMRGLRDCDAFLSVAGAPSTGDFARRFTDAVAPVSALVADANA